MEDRNAPGNLLTVLPDNLLLGDSDAARAWTEPAGVNDPPDYQIQREFTDRDPAVTNGAGSKTESEQTAPPVNGRPSHPASRMTSDPLGGFSDDPFLGFPGRPVELGMIPSEVAGPVRSGSVAARGHSPVGLMLAPDGSAPSGILFGTESLPTRGDPLLASPPTLYTSSGAAPVANNDSYSVAHDRMLVVDAEEGLLANDTDPDDDPLQVVLVTQPAHGTCMFQEVTPYGDGSFNYLPNAGFVGTDSFTYKISDGTSESSLATVTITVTNAVPTAQADQYTTLEDQVLEVGSGGGLPPFPGGPPGVGEGPLLANDADTDDDILRTQLVGNVSSGSLVLRDDGSFVYTPAPNFAGTDSFTYSVTDGVVSTIPVTVTITVQAAGPFDLDGHDGSTLTPWMSEPDEADYGLGVSVGNSAQILTRVYNLPSNWVIDSRRVSFDPSVLSVNGVTQPGYIELSPGGGSEVLTVSALAAGYGSTAIMYEISGRVLGGGPLGEAFATLVTINVVEAKAVLRQLEFTSDHNVLLQNTKDVTTSGNRYSDVEFVRKDKYNAPMSQTKSYAGAASKVKVKVTWDWAGIPANTPFKLEGTSAEEALMFESPVFNAGTPPPGRRWSSSSRPPTTWETPSGRSTPRSTGR